MKDIGRAKIDCGAMCLPEYRLELANGARREQKEVVEIFGWGFCHDVILCRWTVCGRILAVVF